MKRCFTLLLATVLLLTGCAPSSSEPQSSQDVSLPQNSAVSESDSSTLGNSTTEPDENWDGRVIDPSEAEEFWQTYLTEDGTLIIMGTIWIDNERCLVICRREPSTNFFLVMDAKSGETTLIGNIERESPLYTEGYFERHGIYYLLFETEYITIDLSDLSITVKPIEAKYGTAWWASLSISSKGDVLWTDNDGQVYLFDIFEPDNKKLISCDGISPLGFGSVYYAWSRDGEHFALSHNLSRVDDPYADERPISFALFDREGNYIRSVTPPREYEDVWDWDGDRFITTWGSAYALEGEDPKVYIYSTSGEEDMVVNWRAPAVHRSYNGEYCYYRNGWLYRANYMDDTCEKFARLTVDDTRNLNCYPSPTCEYVAVASTHENPFIVLVSTN